MDFKNIHVIINPASGNNEPILNTLNDIFREQGVQWDVSITHKDGDGAKQAQKAIQAGCDLVMAYGGDGTVLDVATGLIDTGVPLGILAGGTANAMADELGVPNNLAKAVALPFHEDVRLHSVDIGQADDKYFLLRVGTGMVATFSAGVSRELKDNFGVGAYFIGGIQAIANPEFVTYHLSIDGKEVTTQGTACLITNGNSLGAFSLKLSPKVKIDDGLLDVFIINNDVQSIIGALSNLVQIENAAIDLEHWQGKEIRILTDPPQEIYGDGETIAFTNTPCDIRLKSKALNILTTQVKK